MLSQEPFGTPPRRIHGLQEPLEILHASAGPGPSEPGPACAQVWAGHKNTSFFEFKALRAFRRAGLSIKVLLASVSEFPGSEVFRTQPFYKFLVICVTFFYFLGLGWPSGVQLRKRLKK